MSLRAKRSNLDLAQANKHEESGLGWQRQAESSELGDGGGAVRQTIAKALPALTLPPNPTKGSRTSMTRRGSFGWTLLVI